MIDLFKVFMSKDVDDFVSPVLQSGYVGEGDTVKEFELSIGNFIQNNNVLTVNSGTSAITMALRLAGVSYGDYVISTPMTCLATNEPILSLGATPIWTDVNPKTGNMDANCLFRLLNRPNLARDSIKAILCVHWGGLPCDLKEINQIARDFGLPVIEDAAHAFGSVYNGQLIGCISDFTCFSFQAIKYLTTVDGGAIAFKNDSLMKRARLMRWYGLDRTKSRAMRCLQDPPEFGYKFHMNNLNAAIGLANIRHMDFLLDSSLKHATIYNAAFRELKSIELTDNCDDRLSTYWLYTIKTNDANELIDYLAKNGIAASKVHGRNDKKTIFASSATDLPGVDEFDSKHVCIPVGWWLTDSDVNKIVDVIKEYKSNG